MSGKMIQVMFLNGDDRLIIRKQAGDEDISGDYGEYSRIVKTDIDGRTVTSRSQADVLDNGVFSFTGGQELLDCSELAY